MISPSRGTEVEWTVVSYFIVWSVGQTTKEKCEGSLRGGITCDKTLSSVCCDHSSRRIDCLDNQIYSCPIQINGATVKRMMQEQLGGRLGPLQSGPQIDPEP